MRKHLLVAALLIGFGVSAQQTVSKEYKNSMITYANSQIKKGKRLKTAGAIVGVIGVATSFTGIVVMAKGGHGAALIGGGLLVAAASTPLWISGIVIKNRGYNEWNKAMRMKVEVRVNSLTLKF